ncbi:hypothetical protein TNCV_4289441 [Trichonephila clavipes]|nr:hypothetical protein TNCV_4289441 [Trichonephila clavipes]
MISCDTSPDDSANVVMSKAGVLKDDVSATPPQLSAVKWWKSVHFVDKFLTATIVASTFAQLWLYVAEGDLLLGITTQLHAFRQCNHVRNHSVAYKPFRIRPENPEICCRASRSTSSINHQRWEELFVLLLPTDANLNKSTFQGRKNSLFSKPIACDEVPDG